VQRTRGLLVKSAGRDEAIDLRQLVRETALLLERELAAHGATLLTDFAADVPLVTASRIEMQQVLINLMTNGLQAMSEACSSVPELIVAVRSPEAGVVSVSIRDRGAGISDENQAKLFDPFFTTKADGMGMGLSICRSTIEARGGSLTARNHSEGGAEFEFVLPAGEGAP
jgi:C4-dicarboxylate-specific signal transduction histidine kinase